MRSALVAFALLLVSGCGSSDADRASSAGSGGGSSGAGAAAGSGADAGAAGNGGTSGSVATGGTGGTAQGCVTVDDSQPVAIATAQKTGEHVLSLPATASSRTQWSEPGNEALVLEVTVGGAVRGHLVLHQGADGASYEMTLGALAMGDVVAVRVSDLSAASAARSACVGPGLLTAAADLPDSEGIERAPILKWPRLKRFDDLPVVLGWSKSKKTYQVLFTNENGGTVAQCGGGAKGIQAEIARWGRALDIEGTYSYGASETWNRCTGKTDVVTHPVRKEGLHPVLYYGDGHNRMFESRGGYGQTCGTGGAEKADGDLAGFDVKNPGNAEGLDEAFVLTLRLRPVALDALGFAKNSGRREALADAVAPWVYRLLDSELLREGKLDQQKALAMQQYLYADVYAADVGGSGDSYCSLLGVGGGFVLRAKTSNATLSGPQMTADYFGGQNNVKRIAIPLDQVYPASAFEALVFDAYDNDGIYWLGLGDVFVPRPVGDNGASIESIHAGKTDLAVYVDDDSSGCSGGVNVDGPSGPAQCVGTDFSFSL